MAGVLRGEIWWADLDSVVGHEQAGLRPVLVLSPARLHQGVQVAIVMAVTSKSVLEPLGCQLPNGLLPKPSWVKINQIRTIALARFRGKLALAPQDTMNKVLQLLNELIGE